MKIVRKVLDNVRGPNLLRNMLILTAGTGFAKLIDVIVLPLLTRTYSPENFGVMAVFTSLVAFLVPIFSVFALAVPLPRAHSNALKVSVLAASCLALCAGVLAIFFALFSEWFFDLFSAPTLAAVWWLLVLAVVGGGMFEIGAQWATRRKAFKQLAQASVAQSFWGNAAQLFFGLAGLTHWGLLTGATLKNAAGTLPLLNLLLRDSRGARLTLTVSVLRRLLSLYSDFITLRLPSQVLMAFSGQALILFSAPAFGPVVAGQISLAMIVAALPLRLLGANVGRAYYAEAAAIGRKRKAEIRTLAIGVSTKLAFASIPPCLVLFFFGEAIFSLAFGEQWMLAGRITGYMSASIAASLITIPVVHTLNVLGHQGYYLRINATRAAGTVALFLVCYSLQVDAVTTVTAYSLLLAIHNMLVLNAILKMLR